MRYKDGIKKTTQVKVKGYDHNPGAGDGALWDMKNMTGDKFPLLSTRRKRLLLRCLEEPHGLYAHDGLFWVDGMGFFANGEQKGTVEAGKKEFVSLGKYLLIFPDKAYYRTDTGEFGALEAEWTGTVTITSGTYGGKPAAANTIKTTGKPFPFAVNEAVKITGCTLSENDKTPIIRELSENKKELRFYENTFAQKSWTGQVTLKREVPDLDFLCENENRVWGCKGDTIYASYLGNPFIWNNFDGLATDSFAVEVGSAGNFTAACSFMGYPMFFKEDHIYKVYGSKPSNFQVMGSARLGVKAGAEKSLAVAGERLFYLSRSGIAACSGGMPEDISHAFGEAVYQNAAGGSDGGKYYVSMKERETGAWHLFVFDTRTGLWHREDSTEVLDFAWDNGGLVCLDRGGSMWLCNPGGTEEQGEEEAQLQSFAEFGDFIENSSDEKGLSKIQLRVELEPGATLGIKLKFDSEDAWQTVSVLQAAPKKRSFLLPVIPRRCDHWRLRLEGTGGWTLYSLSREYYAGSDLGAAI